MRTGKNEIFTLCQKFEERQTENDLNFGFWPLLTGVIKVKKVSHIS